MNEPTPDEYCPHVMSNIAEMTGGWFFAADTPPKAVGMCHECIEWCKSNLSPAVKWDEYIASEQQKDDIVLGAEYVL